MKFPKRNILCKYIGVSFRNTHLWILNANLTGTGSGSSCGWSEWMHFVSSYLLSLQYIRWLFIRHNVLLFRKDFFYGRRIFWQRPEKFANHSQSRSRGCCYWSSIKKWVEILMPIVLARKCDIKWKSLLQLLPRFRKRTSKGSWILFSNCEMNFVFGFEIRSVKDDGSTGIGSKCFSKSHFFFSKTVAGYFKNCCCLLLNFNL